MAFAGVLAGWLSWMEHYSVHQIVGFIPNQGTFLGCEFDPQLG